MPRAPGHTLVIPKAPARNLLDVAPDDLAHVMKVAQRIAKVSVDVFGADGVTLQQFSESAGGQVVFHLHVHVIPRKEGIALEAACERQGSAGRAQGSGREARRRAGGADLTFATYLAAGSQRECQIQSSTST